VAEISLPSKITVHIGKPEMPAQNMQVQFTDYIKNIIEGKVSQSTDENTAIAYTHIFVTHALNRIATKHYRKQGYDFDITSYGEVDPPFCAKRGISQRVESLVDVLFNQYVMDIKTTMPCKSASYLLGDKDIEGFSAQGIDAHEFVKDYYNSKTNIIKYATVDGLGGQFSGTNSKQGMTSYEIKQIQSRLMGVRKNFKAIPKINKFDGVFGDNTENAVRAFQEHFNIMPSGVVDKETFYKIRLMESNMKILAELYKNAKKVDTQQGFFSPIILRQGMQGLRVINTQLYLNVVAFFVETIPLIKADGAYNAQTKGAVLAFQKTYGLLHTGVVDLQTAQKLIEIARDLLDFLDGKIAV